jgi:hypothetical protein
MPFKASETRPQQGRGQTTKTKCPCCGTYMQSVYMKIDGKQVSIGTECPNCIEEKRKNEFNKDELAAICDAVTTLDINTSRQKNERLYHVLEGIYVKSERQLKYK